MGMGNGKGELMEMLLAGGSFLGPRRVEQKCRASVSNPALPAAASTSTPASITAPPGPGPEGSGSPTPGTPAQPERREA